MEEGELSKRLDALDKKVDAVYESAEKVRKYILIVVVVSVVAFVLPLFGLLFAIPSFLSMYSGLGDL